MPSKKYTRSLSNPDDDLIIPKHNSNLLYKADFTKLKMFFVTNCCYYPLVLECLKENDIQKNHRGIPMHVWGACPLI